MAYIFVIQWHVSATTSTAGVRIDKTVRGGTAETISNIALDNIILPKLHLINAILIYNLNNESQSGAAATDMEQCLVMILLTFPTTGPVEIILPVKDANCLADKT